jgi:hypothetical protein
MTKHTSRSAIAPPTPSVTRYRDRIYDDKRHDPYQERGKYKEPAICSTCNAVFHDGRWQWASPPPGAREARCPACRRTQDRMPAGFLTLAGAVVSAHRDELLALVRHVAAREREQHPMHRIIQIDESPDHVVVTTTDVHLPQRIAEAVKHAHHGEFEISYGHDEYSVRVHWQR